MSWIQEKAAGIFIDVVKNVFQYSTTSENSVRVEILAYPYCRIIAGISGTIAVVIAAIGANAFSARATDRTTRDLKKMFECGINVHFIHSAVLLAVPLTKNPCVVSVLMTGGIIIFSGSCYWHALIAKTRINKFTPIVGGALLGLSWFAMAIYF